MAYYWVLIEYCPGWVLNDEYPAAAVAAADGVHQRVMHQVQVQLQQCINNNRMDVQSRAAISIRWLKDSNQWANNTINSGRRLLYSVLCTRGLYLFCFQSGAALLLLLL